MIELCQPPDPSPRIPILKCPPGTTDCHVHVYGPASRYPVASTRAFDVPDALPSTLKELLDTLGVDRVVLVQPSGYGTNNQRHLEALSEVGRPARMIASLRADVSDAELERLNSAGVRGIRYTIGHAGAAPLEEMPEMARRIAALGWHVQLHVMNDGGRAPLVEMQNVLSSLPVDVVLDHVGSVRPSDGINQPSFRALLELLESGSCWIKLSGAYRVADAPPYAEMKPFVDAMLTVNPEHLLWGSDWPHVAFKGKMPNTTDLLDQMLTWVPDEAARKRILVDNPARLYGFEASAR
ncbi:amidohydrolase family protein [Paraburkholderia caribensis]|uniref:amidohydrolase family protein n=1 Tax=Paraburkholderia caribensis TaxID=75105 RepID=UPI001CB666E9|nr:amidohydrolase family protein [Paraburkholderia caribensis]CAG9263214.1 Amidohydro-rel domain-containing protein [Paraburkholderia caribensis]